MRAVLLDALGTLVALEPPAPALRRELLARLGLRISGAQAERAIAAEIAYYRSHNHEGRDASSLADLRRRCGSVLGAALPRTDLAIEELTESLLASLSFTVYPEVLGVLETLRSRGVALAVVSNWDVSLHDVLAGLGIAPLVDAIVTSAESGVSKPDPAIFQRALSLVGALASAAIHVGDSILEDVEGARSAGIRPVLVRRDGSAGPDGVRTINGLDLLLGDDD